MKKYFFLFTVTAGLIAALMLSGNAMKASAQVTYFTIYPTDAENTVTAAGKLQYSSEKSYQTDNYCLIDHYCVKNGDKVKKGDPVVYVYEADNGIDFAPSDIKIKNIIGSIDQISVPEKVIEEIRKYTSFKEICASMDGTVTGISAQDEQIVSGHSVLFKIADRDTLMIPVNINEAYIEKVSPGQKASVRFTALPEKTFSAVVSRISDEAKQVSGLTGKETSVEVTLCLEETDPALRIGYSAECIITISTDRNVLIVPYEYIRSDEKGEYVMTASKHQAIKKYIRTGKEYKQGAEAVTGIRSGDRIIINYQDISDGQRISLEGE